MIGVAISTTGDEHRLGFLETTVRNWDRVLPTRASLFVTVDGDEEATQRAAWAVREWTHSVFRVGQPDPASGRTVRNGRVGVAANKNTGLELLMDGTQATHLFLCDDDTYPLLTESLILHTNLSEPHSMVCWGKHRFVHSNGNEALWNWPRGVLLYARRSVVSKVGGFVEDFGPGGHEHVEWSRRIYQHGLNTSPFISPAQYAEPERGPAMGAGRWWHCEDMPRKGEPLGNLRLRRKRITSVQRQEGDWENIEKIMVSQDHNTAYVPFRALDNGRASATLCESN